ncbi:MAG: hypothetical protein JSR47_25320 [Proteobacteria bacterium]|nr:hypothetical protein [Pseudomonadota bacterium]
MTRIVAMAALAAGLSLAVTAGAQAQTVDMKGTWTGDAQNIVSGPANHHPSTGPGVRPADAHRLSDQKFTMKIDGQDGRRFWGTIGTASKTERVIGSFSTDNKRVYMVDDDGYIDGVVVDATTLDVCYRHVRPDSGVVGCELLKKQ